MDAHLLNIHIDRRDTTTVVALRGELDLATAPRLDRALDTLAAEDIVLDLRALSYLDSTGVRLLLRRDAAVRRRGRHLTIIRGGPPVDRVFTLTQTDRLLDLVA
jgi:anti-anti-sigma factor